MITSTTTSNKRASFLDGTLIRLCSLEMEDRHLFHSWLADRNVTKYSLDAWLYPASLIDVDIWLESVIKDKTTLSLAIADKKNGSIVGYAGIARIDLVNRSGEYYIFIGDVDSWGKGVGTEATRLVVDYGFASLNLHRIFLTVSDENVGGVKAYGRAGFVQEGVFRQACHRDGRYHDKIVMSILRPEWEQARERMQTAGKSACDAE